MWNKGDRVRFLNEVGEGTVLSVLDGSTVMVRTDEGFEYPMPTDELILQPGGNKRAPRQVSPQGAPQRKVEATAPPSRSTAKERPAPTPLLGTERNPEDAPTVPFPKGYPEKSACNLSLGFQTASREDVGKGPFTLYAINESPLVAFITIAREMADCHSTLFHGSIPPHSALKLGVLTAQELRTLPLLQVQALYYSEGLHLPPTPFTCRLELKNGWFARPGSFQSTPFMADDLFLLQVHASRKPSAPDTESPAPTTTHSMAAQGETRAVGKAPQADAQQPEGAIPRMVTVNLLEVQRLGNLKGESRDAILNDQLSAVTLAIESSQRSGMEQRIVVMHGVGNPELRQRVVKMLKSQHPSLTYQDASFREYSYGALMVFIPSTDRSRGEPRA